MKLLFLNDFYYFYHSCTIINKVQAIRINNNTIKSIIKSRIRSISPDEWSRIEGRIITKVASPAIMISPSIPSAPSPASPMGEVKRPWMIIIVSEIWCKGVSVVQRMTQQPVCSVIIRRNLDLRYTIRYWSRYLL